MSILVGLDLGTSVVRAVIAEVNEDNSLQIIGLAQQPSRGMRKGSIINIEEAMSVIHEVIQEAEQDAAYEVTSCIAGIGSSLVDSLNTRGFVGISAPGKTPREITSADMKKVLEASQSINIPLDRSLLHVIPRQYIIDGTEGFKNPLHNLGYRLEADVHIVTASKTAIQNLRMCLNRAGYEMDTAFLKTLAVAQVVLTDDEMEMGSLVIDLGGGTTDVLVVHNGAPVCIASIPVGGMLVTSDIAQVEGIPLNAAEDIKLKYGCCWAPDVDPAATVILPAVGDRAPVEIPLLEIEEIVEARMEEIFRMVQQEIGHKCTVELNGSVVLTGGGANLPGIESLAESVFGTPMIRVGKPCALGGRENVYRTPEFATVVGLVVANKNRAFEKKRPKRGKSAEGDGENSKLKIFQKIKDIFLFS